MFKNAALTAVVTLATSFSGASANPISWDTRFHSGDITGDTPSHAHDAAGYVAAWNAIAGNAPTAGYGDATFTDWTNKSNQNVIPSGANGNYGLHASFSFAVQPNDVGTWTFNAQNDADYGGVLLIDGNQVGINPNNYWPNGPSGSVNLGAGIHTFDLYSFESCCDGTGTSTFLDPLHVGDTPLTISSTNLILAPEPTSLVLFGLGAVGLIIVRRRRRG